MLFDNIFFKFESKQKVAEQRRMKERPRIFTPYNMNRIEKFLCRNRGWNLFSAWGLVKWVFFQQKQWKLIPRESFPTPTYSQLSQGCWPLRVKLAQLALTTGLISSNGIKAPHFRRFEIPWERKMTDINVSEQERKDVILGIVQGVFLFSVEYSWISNRNDKLGILEGSAVIRPASACLRNQNPLLKLGLCQWSAC